jgi:hypothetical protein
MKKYLIIIYFLLSGLNLSSSWNSSFIENQGQLLNTDGKIEEEIKYYNNKVSPTVYVAKDHISFVIQKSQNILNSINVNKFGADERFDIEAPAQFRVDLLFEGINELSKLEANSPQNFIFNYYFPQQLDGITGVLGFERAIYKDIYPDVDFILFFQNNNLNSEFNLKSINAIEEIIFKFEGSKEIKSLNKEFVLIVIDNDTFPIKLPDFYLTDDQNAKSRIDIDYEIDNNRISFSAGKNNSDNTNSLSNFDWSTYAGGSQEDKIISTQFDKFGNVIATGFSYSQNYPTTPGVWKEQFTAPVDIIVMKFSNHGNIIWSTFYGSNGMEFGNAIKADNDNNYWIVGESRDDFFPVTEDAYQKNYRGGTADGLIIKLNDKGQRLYSTYFGGSNYDTFSSLAFDSRNNLWLASRTNSRVYPCTQDAIKSNLDGEYDGVIIQFSNDGKLLYSTYFGGQYDDFYESLVIDSDDNVIVSGYSSSNNYPVSSNTNQNSLKGATNAVLTKLSNDKKVVWSTYFGGALYDYGSNLAIDGNDYLYLHGYTSSINLPTTPDVFQPKFGGESDCFLAKFDNSGKFQWVTYIGGSGYEAEIAGIYTQFGNVACSNNGQIAIAAKTQSKDLKTTEDAFQKSHQGQLDGFFGIFNPDGTASTISYLGGSKIDYAYDIDIYQDSMLVICGVTESPDFPQKNSFQPVFGGTRDGFIVKFGTGTKCEFPAFEYADFKNVRQLNFIGNAHQNENFIRLTKLKVNESGAIWFNKKLPLQYGFTSNFSFRFSEGSNNNCKDNSEEGADGIALVIQNSNPYSLGWSGGGIGYDGIKNSIAIEFDTFSNDSTQLENLFDPNGNHIAVQSNGANENTSKHLHNIKLALNDIIPKIHSDGRTYYVSVIYNPKSKTMTVYFDSTKYLSKPVIFIKDFDLSKLINLESNVLAYIGITGATGCAFQNQDILSWDLCIDKAFPTDVEETTESDDELFSIVPNPANDRLIVSSKMELKENIEIKLINVLGSILDIPIRNQNEVNKNTIHIDIREIPAGFYLLKMINNNISYTKKIIVTK